MRYDEAGNLFFDGTHVFQYDAWNRVIQINQAHLASTGSPPEVLIDGLVKNLAYDGLGRLARVQSPFPTLGSPDLRSERFYYDGIRRLQEVVIDPMDDTSDAALAGNPGALAALAAEPGLDTDAATLGSEESQLDGGGGPAPVATLAREYVWGPRRQRGRGPVQRPACRWQFGQFGRRVASRNLQFFYRSSELSLTRKPRDSDLPIESVFRPSASR